MKIDDWQYDSWKYLPNVQSVCYQNIDLLDLVLAKLTKLPPLVSCYQVTDLKENIALAQQGKAFLLQGGDCAELFCDLTFENTENLINTLQSAAYTLHDKLGLRIVTIGRFAGQFAKPRSLLTESKHGVALDSYRGDMINHLDFTSQNRKPNPKRMLDSYFHSSAFLNFLFQYQQQNHSHLEPFYSSHELLNLYYEQALLRQTRSHQSIYDASGHLLWIGNRTRSLGHAHLEFARGIVNPIGIKLDEKISTEELVNIIKLLNPTNELGKIVLIVRMGLKQILAKLPLLLNAIIQNDLIVAWVCDPMHGNTFISNIGVKYRLVEDMIDEVNLFFKICKNNNTYAAGLHLEMSGDPTILECFTQEELLENAVQNYKSGCDPRLSPKQIQCLLNRLVY